MEIEMSADWNRHLRIRDWAWPLVALCIMLLTAPAYAAAEKKAPAQKSFETPEQAASALVEAVKSHDRSATLAVLGNAGEWISSGDATADREAADTFVTEYEAKHAVAVDGNKGTLTLGQDDFPFAFPLVKSSGRWRFDAAAGKEELLTRRVGRNELAAIKVLQAIVDAEEEYASEDRNGDGVLAYAQKLASSPEKHDGLYWSTNPGEPLSPLGELAAKASSEGYKKGEKPPTPYHGYYYRMLQGQGNHSQDGAMDYVVHGRGIAGFAVVAYPARYGNSGIMTFTVNQDGKIFQSDLGPKTKEKAEAMHKFDSGPGWSAVDSASLADRQ
jgi:hypothetical protein